MSFLEYVRSAYAIRKFDMDFSTPNPCDVEVDFQKPMENLLSETAGSKGITTIIGEDLEKDPIEKLAASAATGNSASVQLREVKDQKSVTKKIGGNPTTLTIDEIATQEEKKELISKKSRFISWL